MIRSIAISKRDSSWCDQDGLTLEEPNTSHHRDKYGAQNQDQAEVKIEIPEPTPTNPTESTSIKKQNPQWNKMSTYKDDLQLTSIARGLTGDCWLQLVRYKCHCKI